MYRLAILCLVVLFSSYTHSAEEYQIPVSSDAREFARLETKLPAVLGYFSQQPIATLRQFYIDQFGSPAKEQRFSKGLQLYFQHEQQQIRVILSQQKQWSQVDIMLQ